MVVLTDGRASDGDCKSAGYTCYSHETCSNCYGKDRCRNAYGQKDPDQTFCTLHYEAQNLKTLPDRNQTVTVVSVGFGRVDRTELELIASSDDNVIIAEGRDASTGFANLKKLLDQLVEKVCLRLPEDCVLEHTPWSECCGGEKYKSRQVKRVLREARNGGKACPTGKQLFKKEFVECPATQPECEGAASTVATEASNTDEATDESASQTDTDTSQPDSDTDTANTPAITLKSDLSSTSSAATTGTDKPVMDDSTTLPSITGAVTTAEMDSARQVVVDGGIVHKMMWNVMIACCASVLCIFM